MFYMRKVFLSLILLNIFAVYNSNLFGMITISPRIERATVILDRLNNLKDKLEKELDSQELSKSDEWGILDLYLRKYINIKEQKPEQEQEDIKNLVKRLNKFKKLIYKKIKESKKLTSESKHKKIQAIKELFKLATNSIQDKS